MGKVSSTLRGWVQPSANPLNRFRRPEYINWIKVGQGLQCCGEGLIDFCTDVIDNFHKSLKQQYGMCHSPSTPKDIKYDKKKKCWEVTCACGICDRWFQSVKQEKATAQSCWNNTNLQDWSLHPWQLAKVFMGQGKDPTSHDPADTDPAGFLQLILNCKRFAGLVDAAKVQAVRDVRNAVMHSAKFEVTSADLTTYLATMTDLLKDQELQKYPTAQRAIVEITKIETLSLDINAATVNELERSIWKAVVEDQTSNKQDILKVIESNEDLKSRLGDVYTKLTADIALLRGEVGALDERVANLEAAKDSTKEDNIRGEVGAHGVRIANLEAAKDPTETTNIRAYVPKNESLKVLTSLFEMQDPDRVDTITSEIKSKQVLPTEMRALSWVLRQAKCPVTNLDLSWCQLNKDLVKQLNDGLAENKSIKSLALMYCHIDDVTAVDIVTGAVTSPKLENLNLGGNHITPGAVRQLKEIRGKPRLLYLGEQESPPAEQHWGCDSRCVPWNQLHQVETATGRR